MAPMTEQSSAGAPQTPSADADCECTQCRKPQALCVCEGIARIDNKVSLVILQHPQEQDRELGTARLTALHFKDSVLKIGLSWPIQSAGPYSISDLSRPPQSCPITTSSW
jgi:hypothetical protein